MSDQALAGIRRLFVERYEDIKERLTRYLGSADLAGDAMHDTWLRLAQTESIGAVQSQQNYLFRAALNAAADRRRNDGRHLSVAEIDSLLEVADEAPTPEQIVLARSELEAFKAMLAQLPARRRTIFLAARLHNIPRQVIADRLGVSRRLVAKELLLAHKAFVERLKEIKG
jgi:RNA polymerase sigma-70 factor (ECF subfamily)